MEKKISLELSQIELRMLYKCLSHCIRVEDEYQIRHSEIMEDSCYRHFFVDLNSIYQRVCDEYQDSCKLFGCPIIDY